MMNLGDKQIEVFAPASEDSTEVLNLGGGEDMIFAPASSTVPIVVDDELQTELQRIPDKMAFRIGEVADLLKVKAYVLRYWESEFEGFKPKKSKHNQRMYERRDVETLMMIKKLLYRDKFSIEGAKAALKKLRKDNQRVKAMTTITNRLEDVRSQAEDLLEDIRKMKAQLAPFLS